jgi:hypothetical protein
MPTKSYLPTVQVLRGQNVPSERQTDLINQAFKQLAPIVDSVSVASVSITVPSTLPAQIVIRNPLGRIALGMICTLRNQPCTVELISSTATTATVSVNLVPLSANGVITGLSKLTGTLSVSLVFY